MIKENKQVKSWVISRSNLLETLEKDYLQNDDFYIESFLDSKITEVDDILLRMENDFDNFFTNLSIKNYNIYIYIYIYIDKFIFLYLNRTI